MREKAWRRLPITLIALFLFSFGCGEEPTEEPEAPPEEAQEDVVEEREHIEPAPKRRMLPPTAVPESPGCYLADGPRLESVQAGREEWLHPTNASRGFGFERPHGRWFTESRPVFVFWSGALELSTLRLTRFDAESLLPERWWERNERGRSAWLPNAQVRLVSERDPKNANLVRVQPIDPLGPGFYALHDGSLVRAETREELSAYFPFQVGRAEDAERSTAEQWFGIANACVEELQGLVIDGHQIEYREGVSFARFDKKGFAVAQARRIRHCAAQIHAVLDTVEDKEVSEKAWATLFTLSALANDLPWAESPKLIEAVNESSLSAPLLYYWLELSALEAALEARRAVVRGDYVAADHLAAQLATLYLDPHGYSSTHGGSRGALESLFWVPYFLDAEWQAVEALTARLATGLDPYEALLLIVAGHRATRLSRFAERFPESDLVNMVEASLRGIPNEVLEVAKGYSPTRGRSGAVHISSPYVQIDEGDEEVAKELSRWLQGKRRGMARCFKRAGDDAYGVVLAKVELSQAFFKPAARFTLSTPNDPEGAQGLPFNNALYRCLEEQVLSLAPQLNATVDATLTFPLTFVSRDLPGNLIR